MLCEGEGLGWSAGDAACCRSGDCRREDLHSGLVTDEALTSTFNGEVLMRTLIESTG